MHMDKQEFEDFNPVDFLNFTLELNKSINDFESSSSSVKRTIFSRIYYAVFLFLRETLANNTEYISNPFGEHRRLPNFIEHKGPFDDDINELSKEYSCFKKIKASIRLLS